MKKKKVDSNFHESLASSAVSQMSSMVGWVETRAKQAAKISLIAAGSAAIIQMLIFWTLIGYLILYWLIIPSYMQVEAPLYFDFDPDLDGPLNVNAPKKTPFEFPTAKLLFSSHDQQWVALVEDEHNRTKRLYPGMHDNHLALGEAYDVSIQLILPESPPNLEVAVFMVETELLSTSEENNDVTKPLVRSRRPVSLPYRTGISTTFRDIIFTPARFLFGWFQPEFHLDIPVIEEWKEDQDSKRLPSGVKVTLSDPRLNIKSSKIKFHLKLYGFRYYMYYWFWTALVFLVTVGVTFESWLAISAMFLRWLTPKVEKKVRFNFANLVTSSSDEEDDDDENEEEEEESDEDEQEEEEEEEHGFDDESIPESSAFEDDPTIGGDNDVITQPPRFMEGKRKDVPIKSNEAEKQQTTSVDVVVEFHTPPQSEDESAKQSDSEVYEGQEETKMTEHYVTASSSPEGSANSGSSLESDLVIVKTPSEE